MCVRISGGKGKSTTLVRCFWYSKQSDFLTEPMRVPRECSRNLLDRVSFSLSFDPVRETLTFEIINRKGSNKHVVRFCDRSRRS